MIEFLTTALAALMIVAPVNTTCEISHSYESTNIAIYQTHENDMITFVNSSNITVKTPNGSNVSARVESEIFTEDEKFDYMEFFVKHPEYNLNPVTSDCATSTYGNHAYAWYRFWVSNYQDCWLNEVSPFINDKSFVRVDTPQINDIIAYGNYEFENGEYIFNIIHSGIVIGFTGEASNGICGNANTVKVESKCGALGLYQHKGDECPYIEKYNFSYEDDRFSFFFDEFATEVRYFRRHTHKYTYKSINSVNHTKSCVCGENKTEGHIWIPYSGTILSLGEELDNYANPLAITKTRVECKYCHYIKILSDDEIIPILP